MPEKGVWKGGNRRLTNYQVLFSCGLDGHLLFYMHQKEKAGKRYGIFREINTA